jgi:hypothetical protein
MKASLPETRIARVTVQQVDVGQLSAGPIAIGKVTLDAVHVGVSTGTVKLRNVRVTIGIEIKLHWDVSVDIPLVGTFRWDGTIDFGTHTMPVPLGDVGVPGLQNLAIDLNSVSANNVKAVIGAIRNLRLGPILAEQIRANNAVAPSPGFTLAGLGLGSVDVEDLAVPGVTATDATVGHVHGDAFPPGDVTISGLALPQTSLGQIVSQALDTRATSNPLVLSADAGVLNVSLSLTPSARMEADELRLNNVRATASVGAVVLRNVVLPYDVLDVKLSQLGIATITVPKIEVA